MGDICVRCGIPIENDNPSSNVEMRTLELSSEGEGIRHQLKGQVCHLCSQEMNQRPKKRRLGIDTQSDLLKGQLKMEMAQKLIDLLFEEGQYQISHSVTEKCGCCENEELISVEELAGILRKLFA